MKLPIFAIRDAKTGFLSPTVDMNDPAAIRNFEHAVRNSGSLMNSHPQDYSLFRIGEFDNETGEVSACLPANIADATSVL